MMNNTTAKVNITLPYKPSDILIKPIDRTNWEDVLTLRVKRDQRAFVPSPAESLAAAYIKPWDEALDPYGLYLGEKPVGLFYLSYTPDSIDNYWIGGFMIDRRYQGRGLGRAAMKAILDFVVMTHPRCCVIQLTVEKENHIAQNLYKSLGFGDTATTNKYGEIIYCIPVRNRQ